MANPRETLLQRLMDKFGLKSAPVAVQQPTPFTRFPNSAAILFLSCKVANDEFGDYFVQELGDLNIHTNLGDNREDGVTGKCLVMVSPDAERTMLSYLGISETLSKDEIDVDALKDSEYLYLEGYQVTSDTGREACVYARQIANENGVKTSITLSDPAMVQFFRVVYRK